MNLHAIVSQAISVINPMILITLRRNAGYTTLQDGSRVPSFTDSTGKAQVQALSSKDLAFVDSQGIQGNMRAIYLYGDWHGIVKTDNQGGDILFFNNKKWLVTQVMETWPDWCKVIVTLQDDII